MSDNQQPTSPNQQPVQQPVQSQHAQPQYAQPQQQPVQPQPQQPVQQPVQPQPAPQQYAQPATPQYAPPQYAAPQPGTAPYGAPQPGAPQPGVHPYPAYGYVLPSGRKFWALGFLFFIPYVGWLVSLIVVLALAGGARRDPNPVVRENARWAANWNLTVITALVVSVLIVVASGVAGAATDSAGGDGDAWLPFAIFGLLFGFAVGITHLVISIMGTIQADRQVFKPAIAIPFIRPIA